MIKNTHTWPYHLSHDVDTICPRIRYAKKKYPQKNINSQIFLPHVRLSFPKLFTSSITTHTHTPPQDSRGLITYSKA